MGGGARDRSKKAVRAVMNLGDPAVVDWGAARCDADSEGDVVTTQTSAFVEYSFRHRAEIRPLRHAEVGTRRAEVGTRREFEAPQIGHDWRKLVPPPLRRRTADGDRPREADGERRREADDERLRTADGERLRQAEARRVVGSSGAIRCHARRRARPRPPH
ncbi:hypothetical protein M885DRAFT_531908, partial [Pelagophyceae sp. CCMP2097]